MTINHRDKLKQARRWVVKIGSALLTANGQGLDQQAMHSWVAQMAALAKQGIELVLVSSGAVAEGMVRMGLNARPDSLHDLQACADHFALPYEQIWTTEDRLGAALWSPPHCWKLGLAEELSFLPDQ